MVHTSIASILFIFVTSIVQAAPDNFHSTSDSLASILNTTDEPLLVAKKESSKDNGENNKKRKVARQGGGVTTDKGRQSGKGHNNNYPGVENGKHIFSNSTLPVWAHDCGLPPGLAKQNKIPPGWENKCRNGFKYYDHEQEFRQELLNFYGIIAGKKIKAGSPVYEILRSMDEADCQVKSVTSASDVLEGAAKGFVYGGIIGAGTGAVIGAVTDNDIADSAIYGAGAGALTGTIIGGIVNSQKYKSDYHRCMQNNGYYSHSSGEVREQPVAHRKLEVLRISGEKKWRQFWM